MHKLRAISLICAGMFAGALASVGIQAYAEKNSSTLPLQEIRQFTSVFNAVKDYYVDEVEDRQLLQSAVEGMVSGLDPHSSYLDVDGFKDMNEATQGSFGGLGGRYEELVRVERGRGTRRDPCRGRQDPRGKVKTAYPPAPPGDIFCPCSLIPLYKRCGFGYNLLTE